MPLELRLSLFSKARFTVSHMRRTPWPAMAASDVCREERGKGDPGYPGPMLQATGMPFGDVSKAASTTDLKPLNSHMAGFRAISAISHRKHVSKSGAEIGRNLLWGSRSQKMALEYLLNVRSIGAKRFWSSVRQ